MILSDGFQHSPLKILLNCSGLGTGIFIFKNIAYDFIGNVNFIIQKHGLR